MRLFIAIPLPQNILEAIIKLQEPIRGIKWENPGKMHLTLHFLGETKQKQLSGLKAALQTIQIEKFTVHIEGVGVFPNRHSPRVIWAGVKKSRQLLELQQKVETCCRQAGFKPENRSYKPHITFGRVRNTPIKQISKLIESKQARSLSLKTDVDHFNLYRSELNRKGAVHHVIETFLF